jgi:16S rRNA (guanine966-N2)-methyltransferase
MRIISGNSKGKRLKAPKGQTLRPTSDRVKESIFNILGREIKGKTVLDLFAGTGNLGIEALSRGAARAVFIEKGRQAIRVIEKNLSQCGMWARSEIIQKDVHRAIGVLEQRGDCFDLVFMDPPYERGLVGPTLKKLQSHRIYHEGSVVVIEHDRREPLPDLREPWTLTLQRRIGDTLLSFMSPESVDLSVDAASRPEEKTCS